MSASQMAKAIIANAALLGILHTAATWGTRVMRWNPQNYVSAILNAVIGKTVEVVTLKAQLNQTYRNMIPPYSWKKKRIISALLGTLAAAGLTPKIAQLFGQKITYQASAVFSLSTLSLTAYQLYRR
jgi:cytochrome c biogenesis protein CcdA